MKAKKDVVELIWKWNTTRQLAEIRGDKEIEMKALKHEIHYLRHFLSELGLHKVVKLQREIDKMNKKEPET